MWITHLLIVKRKASFYSVNNELLSSTGYFLHTNMGSLQRSFQGCMQMIHIDDHLADLRAVEQGLIGNFENVSLDMCVIIDRYKVKLEASPGASQ